METQDRRSELEQKVLDALFSTDPTKALELETHAFGDVEEHPIRYFIYADVLQELLKAARFRDEDATAILIGHFAMDDRGPFIEVTAFRELNYLYGADAVELTYRGLREILDELQGPQRLGGDHIVGVFVARPDGEAHIDEEIAHLHLSLFNLPYQLAAVIDGVSDEIAFYARAPGGVFFNTAFYLVQSVEESAANDQ